MTPKCRDERKFMPIKYDYLSKFEYKFMSCIPSKFLNFGIVIYYTAKSRSPIYFIYLFIYFGLNELLSEKKKYYNRIKINKL